MKPFLNIPGASGSTYRSKGIENPGELPATAGNFIFARTGSAGDEVICCGTAGSLMLAEPAWKSAIQQHHVTELYIRLNVSIANNRLSRGFSSTTSISRLRLSIAAQGITPHVTRHRR